MDPIIWTALGSAVAVMGLLYLMFIGERSLAQWWRDRKGQLHRSVRHHRRHGRSSERCTEHNLPSRGVFIGREKYMQEALAALASRYSLVCLEGLGGIGKTVLAIQVAYACLKTLPKGKKKSSDSSSSFKAVIWTTAREAQLQLESVLDMVARVLGYPYVLQLPMPEKEFEVNKLLKEQKCLIVIDNFDTVSDKRIVEFLRSLPEPSTTTVLGVSRSLERSLHIVTTGKTDSNRYPIPAC